MMEHINFPDRAKWDERSQWFDDLIEERMRGSYMVGEQATALCSEMYGMFCIGAWYSVIIISVSVIDAQLRECEILNFKGNTYELAKQLNFTSDFDWLRKKRNRLVHLDINNPIANVNDYDDKTMDLESEARRAIEIVFDAFFLSPGT